MHAVCATHLLRGCALLPKRRARLSALTLAALATGYYPDGSAPEPGFLKTQRQGVLPVRRIGLELSTLRADRSFCRSLIGRVILQQRLNYAAVLSALAKGALSEQGERW